MSKKTLAWLAIGGGVIYWLWTQSQAQASASETAAQKTASGAADDAAMQLYMEDMADLGGL